MRNYSAGDRQRIWNKLTSIRNRYPKLGVSDIAAQITALRGGNFDRKYFQRLKDGSLSDELTNDIVEWISHRYDAEFGRSFSNLGLADGSGVSIPVAKGIAVEWAAEPDLSQAVISALGKILPEAKPADWFAIKCRFLTFLGKARLIRAKAMLDGELEQYLIENDGALYPFDGSVATLERICRALPLALDETTIVDLVAFLVEFVSPVQGRIVQTPDQLLRAFQNDGEGGQLDMSRALDLFEPIQIHSADQLLHATVQFDAIASGAYHRCTLRFKGAIHAFELSWVQVLDRIRGHLVSKPPTYRLCDERVHSAYDLDALVIFIKQFPIGALHTKLLDTQAIRIKTTAGPKVAAAYVPDEKLIIFQYRDMTSADTARDAAHLMMALARAAIHLAGFEEPSREDLKAWAAFQHGANLDVLTSTARFLIEMSDSNTQAAEAVEAIRALGLDEFVNAVRSQEDRAGLYSIYVKMYDAQQRGAY